jgi:hypothetical protein
MTVRHNLLLTSASEKDGVVIDINSTPTAIINTNMPIGIYALYLSSGYSSSRYVYSYGFLIYSILLSSFALL